MESAASDIGDMLLTPEVAAAIAVEEAIRLNGADVPMNWTCPECGARALQRVDGCERCPECNYVGSCG